MSSCEIMLSRTGREQLILGGYIYCKNKVRNDVFYWTCIEKCNKMCNVGLKTIKREQKHYVASKSLHPHSHIPDPDNIRKRKLHLKLKEKARGSMDTPVQIIQQCTQDVPSTSAPFMPSKPSMKRMINRTRNQGLPKIPTKLEDLEIPEEYETIDGKQFLIAHYNSNGNIVLVFSTEENLKLLSCSDFWVMDGTFKCCPLLLYQMYTIQGRVGKKNSTNEILPLVYGFMNKKNEESYFIFFEILQRFIFNKFGTQLKPQVIITDFEKAAINASQRVFPCAKHKCCLFHLKQIIWRHIEGAKLDEKYLNDSDFAHKLKHISALPYIPASEIPSAFEQIKETVLPVEAEPLSDWFSKTYVNGTYKKKEIKTSPLKVIYEKRPPTFPPELWSVADSIECGIPTTQNSIESWHMRWNTLLNGKKINIFKTLDEVKKEIKRTENDIQRILAQIERPKKRKQLQLNVRLQNHLLLKDDMDINSFLSGIAYITYMSKK